MLRISRQSLYVPAICLDRAAQRASERALFVSQAAFSKPCLRTESDFGCMVIESEVSEVASPIIFWMKPLGRYGLAVFYRKCILCPVAKSKLESGFQKRTTKKIVEVPEASKSTRQPTSWSRVAAKHYRHDETET